MIRLVLFDIDGTLIATGGAGQRAFAAVARCTFGHPNGVAEISFAGRTDRGIVREFLVRHRLPATPANIDRFLDDYVFWLDHLLGRLPGTVLPAVTETLHGLRQLPEPPEIGLLTGNIRLGAELKLRHYGLWSEFAMGAFGDDDEHRNRVAAIARERGEERAGRRLDGSEILVIGDTPLDIECAKAIGARSLAVATGGYDVEALRSHEPDWAVRSLEEVETANLCR